MDGRQQNIAAGDKQRRVKVTRCEAGLIIQGKFPGGSEAPSVVARVGSEHPIRLGGRRIDIPQPGAFSHFHWVGAPASEDGLLLDTQYDGYILG